MAADPSVNRYATWDYPNIFLVISGLVVGGLYMWFEGQYTEVVRRKTGLRFPVLGSEVTWYLRRPWQIPRGISDLIAWIGERQQDPEVESARQRFLIRRNALFLAATLVWFVGLVLVPRGR